jgi:transcriptional regulator with XRE-family HTH domain
MSTQLTEEIAKRLRAARKAAGFKSAKSFASKNDIPLSTYSQHETGKRSISAELILNYSRHFQVHPYWLLTGEGEPYFDDTHQDQKVIIEKETFSISSSAKLNEKLNEYRRADVELLKKILLKGGPLLEDPSLKLSYSRLIHHCFEIYNTVANLTASSEEKEKIIQLTLSSLKQGNDVNIE